MSGTLESGGGRQSDRAKAFFQTGNDAALKNNLDYAIQMFREALKLAPESLSFRQALRSAQRRRFQNDPSKVSMLVGARNQPIRLRAHGSLKKGKWVEALEHCEDAFGHNPWDVHAALVAAEAAEGLGQPVLARWYLESVHAQAGEDAAYFRALARAYELNEDWDRSISCWEKVRKITPSDDEAIRKVRGLQASATIARSGLGKAIHRAETAGAGEGEGDSQGESGRQAAELEDLKRQALTPEQRMLKQIEDEPTRVGHYLELAELLKRSQKLDEAEKVLHKGKKVLPNEELLLQAHADVQVARLRRALSSWERKHKEQPDDAEAKSKVEQLLKMLQEYEEKEYRRRIEARPEDMSWRYQLGLRLAAAGRHDEAIAEFQKTRADNSLRLDSLFQTGLCFEAKQLPKLAARSYEEALKTADADDSERLNAIHYRMGRAAEAYGDLKVAEEHYNEVAASDYSYEDVAQRLQSLNQRGRS